MNPKLSIHRPLAVKALIPVQLVLSLLAIPSGALFLFAPGGEAIGAQTILPRLTRSVPFIHDFTVVGIFLIVVYGLMPLLFSYGLWFQKRWAWILTVLLGVAEIDWILVEVLIFYDLGFFIFYPIIGGMGAITIALCCMPSSRRFYME